MPEDGGSSREGEGPCRCGRARDEPPEVMTATEVADWLGLDPKTVYAAVQRGELPHRRIGKKLLFHRQTLTVWLASSHSPVVPERKR